MNPFFQNRWMDAHTAMIGYLRDTLNGELPDDLAAQAEVGVRLAGASYTRSVGSPLGIHSPKPSVITKKAHSSAFPSLGTVSELSGTFTASWKLRLASSRTSTNLYSFHLESRREWPSRRVFRLELRVRLRGRPAFDPDPKLVQGFSRVKHSGSQRFSKP